MNPSSYLNQEREQLLSEINSKKSAQNICAQKNTTNYFFTASKLYINCFTSAIIFSERPDAASKLFDSE